MQNKRVTVNIDTINVVYLIFVHFLDQFLKALNLIHNMRPYGISYIMLDGSN